MLGCDGRFLRLHRFVLSLDFPRGSRSVYGLVVCMYYVVTLAVICCLLPVAIGAGEHSHEAKLKHWF